MKDKGFLIREHHFRTDEQVDELAALRASMNGQRKALEMVIEENKALRAQVEVLQGAYNTAKDHAAALRAENAKLREVLSALTAESATMCRELGRDVKLVFQIQNAVKLLNSTSPDSLYSSAPEMLELSKMVLRADAEANSGDYGAGMCDCKDNAGGRYQSEYLAGVLSKIAALIDKIEVNPTPAAEIPA